MRLWDVCRVDLACALVEPYVTEEQVAEHAPEGWVESGCDLR